MGIVVFWVAIAVCAGLLAGHKGRSGIGWLVLALIAPPAILVLVCLPKARPGDATFDPDTGLYHRPSKPKGDAP